MLTKNIRLLGIIFTVGLLLTIPLIANFPWDLRDFIVAGVLLLGTGLICEMVLRKVSKMEHRVVVILVILAVLFLIWAELAVGVFGTPFAGS